MRQMAYVANSRSPAAMPPRLVNSRGRSGRCYALTPERLDSFVLSTDGLYMLARGTLPLWVGTAHDVIHDAQSRARFRLALAAADRAFAVAAEKDNLSRITTVWDLEGTKPETGQNTTRKKKTETQPPKREKDPTAMLATSLG